jgi:hypothetical protein
MANTAEEILGALRSAVVALGDLETPIPNDPYVADAKSFATQAGVCVEKHMLANGQEVPPDPSKPAPEEPKPQDQFPELAQAPAKETRRDRNKAS